MKKIFLFASLLVFSSFSFAANLMARGQSYAEGEHLLSYELVVSKDFPLPARAKLYQKIRLKYIITNNTDQKIKSSDITFHGYDYLEGNLHTHVYGANFLCDAYIQPHSSCYSYVFFQPEGTGDYYYASGVPIYYDGIIVYNITKDAFAVTHVTQ